jgi:uncharacterized protein (TIGR02001 family)
MKVKVKVKLIKSLVAGSLIISATSGFAEDTASDYSFSANIGLYSDYIFRGYTQTQGQPALQGGFDMEHKSGFYGGTWASNVDWTTAGGYMNDNSIEIDLYAGYATEVSGLGLDAGVLQFIYPGDDIAGKASTSATELYAGVSKDIGAFSLGLTTYYVLSDDAWGFANADGSIYWDLSVATSIGPLDWVFHLGDQSFEGSGNESSDYTDWKVDVSYALNDKFTVGAFYTDTDMTETTWTVDGEYLGDSAIGAYLSAGF